MVDTASLVARVKTEGVTEFNRQLDEMSQNSNRSDSAVKKLTDDLKLQNSQIGKSKEQITLMNAALAGATKAELDLIRSLQAEEAELKRVEALRRSAASASSEATGKLGALGAAAGQVGFQVQDMVVQLAGGASAFAAIGQQGSQLAGAFGPGGAVLGAVIALAAAAGGVLYKSLGDATKSAEELDKSAKELASSFQQSKDGTLEFSDALVALSQSGDLAYNSTVKLLGLKAQQQVEQTTKAIDEQAKTLLGNSVAGQANIQALDDLISKNADVSKVIENVNVITDASSGAYANLKAAVGELSDEYGVGTKAVTDMLVAQREFNKEPSAENAQKLADSQSNLAQEATKNKQAAIDQAAETQKLAINLSQAEKQLDLVTDAQKRTANATNSTTQRIKEQNDSIIKNIQISNLSERDRANAMAAADKEAFAKRDGVTKEQITAYNAARDEEARQDIKRINDTETKKNAAVTKQSDNRAAAAAKREENEAARQRKAAETFIDGVKRQGADEIANINETEQQKLAKLADFQQQGAVSVQQYEDTKTKIQVDAEAARQEILDAQKKKKQEQDKKGDDFLAQIMGQNATELELFDIQQKQKEEVAKSYREQGLIDEDEYQQSLLAIAGNYNKKRGDEYAAMLGQTTDDLKAALGEGNKAYKAFAIANAIMNTYQGAVAAFQSAAAIPIVGWVAAPIAAAAAVASGLASVAKIRAAREQGGQLAAGQASTIAERNKPEVIMPAGASRVRTAAQMRQIMGEDSASNKGGDSVTIVNNTTGRVDSATTERDDEGRLRVIINEFVTSQLSDSNSDISKTRRATRSQPGF